MFTKKGKIVGKAAKRFGWQKKEKKRQAVKKRYSDKKESIKQYKEKKICGTSNIKYFT